MGWKKEWGLCGIYVHVLVEIIIEFWEQKFLCMKMLLSHFYIVYFILPNQPNMCEKMRYDDDDDDKE